MTESSSQVLVLVAHPTDETIGFSQVCGGADVISVTGGVREGGAASRADSFRRACKLLGAKHILLLDLPDISPWRLPVDVLIDRLRGFGSYSHVYTHSPFESHVHQRDVALAASQCFEEIWVRNMGGYAPEVHVLDQQAYQRKLDILNTVYPRERPLSDDELQRPAVHMPADIAGIKSFVPVRWPEVLQALALTSPEIRTDLPNVWAFEVSPYEIERYQRTCEVLEQACLEPPTSGLDLGACEGLMTLRLRQLFPSAKIIAVKSHPIFVRRLRERLSGMPDIDVVEASILDISLSADLIVMAEMLYYVPEPVLSVLHQLRSRYLLTAYHNPFDTYVRQGLQAFGWRESVSAEVCPRFEPVDGRQSLLIARRPGSYIRLWRSA